MNMVDFLFSWLAKSLNPLLRDEPAVLVSLAGITLGVLTQLRGKVPARYNVALDLLIRFVTLWAVRKLVRPAGVQIMLPKGLADRVAAAKAVA